MAIDKMGSRFYMQQNSRTRRVTRKSDGKDFTVGNKARLKKDIVADIEKLTGQTLKSLMNVTKPTLEDLYAAICVCVQKG